MATSTPAKAARVLVDEKRSHARHSTSPEAEGRGDLASATTRKSRDRRGTKSEPTNPVAPAIATTFFEESGIAQGEWGRRLLRSTQARNKAAARGW